ncbi:jg9120 [Pararge aegeria aegeria]|uniref:Jg9120 protein n=1 Tax=Pararge aegeria aegeria TaxID=348720 RepID=A0A8S4SCL0_9NEOP|nr:jg9120 [Pararge aegeria aegeria]
MFVPHAHFTFVTLLAQPQALRSYHRHSLVRSLVGTIWEYNFRIFSGLVWWKALVETSYHPVDRDVSLSDMTFRDAWIPFRGKSKILLPYFQKVSLNE